jgi:hypothetical protein
MNGLLIRQRQIWLRFGGATRTHGLQVAVAPLHVTRARLLLVSVTSTLFTSSTATQPSTFLNIMCLSMVSALTGNHNVDLEAQHVSRPLGAFNLLSSFFPLR